MMSSTLQMKVSRQRAHQIRMRQEGRCANCGEPAAQSRRKDAINGKSTYCEKHLAAVREYQRLRNGAKRRNLAAASYQSEMPEMAKAVGN